MLALLRPHCRAVQFPCTRSPPALEFVRWLRSSSSGGQGGQGRRPSQDEATEDKSSSASKAEEGSAGSPSQSSADGAADSKGRTGAPALFALPLYRKPAFPGFYQIVQVSEQGVLDFLVALRKNGQGDYLGGFMTKAIPSKVLESDALPEAPKGATGLPNQNLRRDAGRVASASELEEVGTVLQVINLTPYPNMEGGQIVVMPHRRIRRTRVVSGPSPNVALAAVAVEYLEEPEVPTDDERVKALRLEIVAKMKELLKTSFLFKEQFEQVIKFYDLDNPLKLADLVAGMSLAQRSELQAVLEENDILERLEKVLTLAQKDLEFAKLQSKVKSQVEEKVSKDQRRLMLMEQMKQISKELGIEKDDKQTLLTQFREAIKDKTVPEEVNKVIEAELTKLSQLEPSSSEFNVCRTYLEWLTCLPWGKFTEENQDIALAEQILGEDHYGLEDVKQRILEHIAVSFLKASSQGKIMCMVGPPGVGKTSISKSIARALDRKFFRFSVGGLHDVSELRGHRRTYVGAMPGKLIQCLKTTQSSNPVILIDEIDKLGRDMRGDPSSAMLEILDPEQNNTFRDHYLDVPVDLSNVLFVCTANVLDTIPGPLLDRMEVIRIAGYVFEEKLAIANQYLVPQTQESSGVGPQQLTLEEAALQKMIGEYAREAGVRHLRQLLEKVSRKVALSLVRKSEEERDKEPAVVSLDNLTEYIGQPQYVSDRLFSAGTPPGVVMGLAWTALGGASLFVEARGRIPHLAGRPLASGPGVSFKREISDAGDSKPGEEQDEDVSFGSNAGRGLNASMQVTGQLGSVMNESSSISLTYASIFLRELSPSNRFLDEAKIHLNVPEGATPKDGPSAGVTMATALLSLALDKSVRADLAMTGELTLMGKVLKVGGIKEKVIAARREKVHTLLLPRQNEADYSELKEYLRAGMTAHFVDHFDDIYRFAFDQAEVPPLPFEPRGLPVSTIVTSADAAPPPLTAAQGARSPQPEAA
eukprot:TRINITY_DN2450_c0_g1_i1.p1 TRINITY_DN2450_c0_g1~~TRINITY_DN2450_c0_g1_i1.p1  ORF type:complete len:997 (-),score=250.97 TRINITY_DN2450_c0_g1_i1:27-2981(-)